MQAADFLFGASAQPHDFLHEPLLRILATGFARSSPAAASLNVSLATPSCINSHAPLIPMPVHSNTDSLSWTCFKLTELGGAQFRKRADLAMFPCTSELVKRCCTACDWQLCYKIP